VSTNSSLTIIIPVYNEEKTIISILNKLSSECRLIKNKKIVVVDDGSKDQTPLLLKNNSKLYSKLITSEKNLGKGGAIILALNSIKTGYVIIQDADLEYDPAEIPRLWNLVKSNDIDVLLTTRISGSPLTRVHYFWHKQGNRLITFVFNIVNNTTFTDIYSGYIIFKRDLINHKHLIFKGWAQQAEILTFLKFKSKRIYEAPITYKGRTYEEGKKINATAVAPVLFSMFWSKLRLYLLKENKV
jgi:glycosyltransferase involved in cell wall biosynthesis